MRSHVISYSVGFILLALIATPFLTQAVTADELRQQIADLFAKIQELQAQLDTLGTQTNTTTGGVGTGTGGIFDGGLSLYRDIERGDSGSDVTALQQFLARDTSVYPERQVTGYYGPLTEQAVQRFQLRCGIVSYGDYTSTGYGRVGPKTRAAFQYGCAFFSDSGGGTSGQYGGYMSVSPISGAAPLFVTVHTTVNTPSSCDTAVYNLNFGDGTAIETIHVPANVCRIVEQDVMHTYTNPGTYSIVLGAGSQQTSVTVTVRSTASSGGSQSQSGTIVVSPVTGNAPLAVTLTGSVSSCSSGQNTTYTIEFGDGNSTTVPTSCGTYSIPHTYASSGTYTAILYARNSGSSAKNQMSSASLVVGASGGNSSGTGADQNTNTSGDLSIEIGVDNNPKKVRASFENGTPCWSYSLSWGDSSANVTYDDTSQQCTQVVTQKEFTHTYTSAGTYTIRLKHGSGRLADLTSEDTAVVIISN